MKISSYSVLNDEQKGDIEGLVSACKEYEPITLTFPMTNEENYNREIDCYYLLYDEEALISGLALSMPDRETCEIMGFTHPKSRRQGAFTMLLEKVEEDFADNDSIMFIFITDGNSLDAKNAIEALDGTYCYSEYIMELELIPHDEKTVHIEENRLSIKIEETNTIEQEENIAMYYSYLEGYSIGSCAVSFYSSFAYLFGLSIDENFRGKGYGKEFLRLILENLMKRKISKIQLQVSSQNIIPLHLYHQIGFLIVQKLEYFFW